jgi:DNA polymerase III epsilon subunit
VLVKRERTALHHLVNPARAEAVVQCSRLSQTAISHTALDGILCGRASLNLMSVPSNAVVFDLETTGLSPHNDAILEIGAIVIEDGLITDQVFHSLINPHRPIPWFVTKVHGIRNHMVSDAPDLETVLPAFLDFVADRTLVAHNAGFDMGFLSTHAGRLGLRVPRNIHCTMELSRRMFPHERRHNLDAVCMRLGILAPTNRHRALQDAEVTAQAFVRMNHLLTQANAV